ncbi:MAG: V-type ATP synthase subunit F [candidate division WS2 bacterium]|nr:V-type ATP synthase subunit F [Candidatus Psychracetigena formicireducens]
MSEEKFIILGSEEFIMTYKALGLEGVVIQEPEELEEIINTYSRQDYNLFFVEESLGSKIYNRFNQYEEKGKYIVLIGGTTTSNFTLNKLKQLVERLVGVDLFKEEDHDKG